MADSDPVLRKLSIELRPDASRTVIRPFMPSDPAGFDHQEEDRPIRIVRRVLAFDTAAVARQIDRLGQSISHAEHGAKATLLARGDELAGRVPGLDVTTLDEDRRMLIGAYFSAEYSFEAAALFNPSIVAWPIDAVADAGGDTPFVLSLRGIGEGHLSSVTFRTGIWRADGDVVVDTPAPSGVPPVSAPIQGWQDANTVRLDCSGSREPSETVLFPMLESQARGIEDLRLTPITMPDHALTFIGTYTAVGVTAVRQEILQTNDFRSFKMHPVHGGLADAKGMALFPRQVDGRYLALGRQDNENLWLASSDDLLTWQSGTKILSPKYAWESVQIGNCGSPIEIDEGWLVLTHGVGVVRNYCMGAVLLDRSDPRKVLGRLAEPLIEPGDHERDGYVPNVIYSCGALVRGREMLLPYAVADNFTRFAIVSVDRLLAAM
ncbi:glycoside hydrolase family 130 protein [soil metagenome]